MNLNIRGIHYQISDETRDFLDKKLAKLDFAESYTVKVVSYDCYELYEGIEMIADKIEAAARKEKSKVIEG